MNNTDKIKEAKHILTMIEAGDINHDEINARVSCVVFGYKFEKLTEYGTIISDNPKEMMNLKKFTQSLDACQSLMLEGWLISIQESKVAGGFKCILYYAHLAEVASPHFKIMPEAWLHAILQSYIYEWSNEDD